MNEKNYQNKNKRSHLIVYSQRLNIFNNYRNIKIWIEFQLAVTKN